MVEKLFFLIILFSFLLSVYQLSMFVVRRMKKERRSEIDMKNFLQNQRKPKKKEKLSDIPSRFLDWEVRRTKVRFGKEHRLFINTKVTGSDISPDLSTRRILRTMFLPFLSLPSLRDPFWFGFVDKISRFPLASLLFRIRGWMLGQSFSHDWKLFLLGKIGKSSPGKELKQGN